VIPKELRIPGYEIEVLLGKGGMAAVYQARQKSFGREVALKVLNPSPEDLEEFSRRFMQESNIVAKLHHSHIVQVYDVGRHKDFFYISMEYLHGGDLSTKLKEGLSLRDSVKIIKQLADALDFAHRKNIIHRDIKPANVMFREDGAAVLTDFGIAKELESQTELTQAGVVIGTPRYMSPEQIRGDKVDHRADIYSLGIVFYRCLTNYVPFDGKDMLTTAYLQDNEPVPTLPTQVACFQPIINRMLEKNPDDRFQRGRDVAEALENLDRTAFQPDITNLDVAEANMLAPPTVTSISGRYPSAKMPAAERVSDMEGTQFRAIKPTTGNPTVRAEHMIKYEPLEVTPRPVPARRSVKKSAARTVLLVFMLCSVVVFASTYYSHELTRFYGSALLADISPRLSELWTKTTQSAAKLRPAKSPTLEAQVAEPVEQESLAVEESVDSTQFTGEPSELSPVDMVEAEVVVEEPVVEEPPAPPEPDPAEIIAGLLEEAEAHMTARRLRRPVSDNAYLKFQQVLEIDPENAAALEGLTRIANTYVAMAERAIREKQFDQARNHINEARAVVPGLASLSTLESKLAAAIVEQQEQEALAAAAQKAAKIESLLAAADADAQAGRIRSPVGNNALEKYQQVLDLDPNNVQAIEKLIEYGR
jgi:serine/threonine-protein kinase PpkA